MKKQLTYFLFVLTFLFFSSYGFSQWSMCDGIYGGLISSTAVSGNNIFAGVYYGGVFLSTNNGVEWSQTSLNTLWVRSLVISGNNIFAGTDRNGVYRSTNNGVNWTQTPLNNKTIYALGVLGSNIFAGTDSNGIYRSTNNGQNWTQTSLNNKIIYAFTVSGSNIFAGTGIAGVYRSTNNGLSWTQIGLNRSIYCLTVSGSYIFAGASSSNGGVYVSTNSGLNWLQTSLNNKWIRSFAVNQGVVFAGTDSGVFLTKNNGTNWFKKNQGFPFTPSVNSLLYTNNYIFAGTNGYSVWRRLYTEIIGIQNFSTGIPSGFSLSQNYPNPFNSMTNIKFKVARHGGSSTNVKLAVFDVLGREITTLVNERLQPGTYEIKFDANGLTSGIYFYQLKADDFLETKKFILLK